MAPVMMPVPRTDAADRARPPMGPDHAADAMPITVIARIPVIGRREIGASMEVAPLMEVRPVIRVAISDIATAIEARSCSIATAAEHGTAAMDRKPAAPEAAAVKGTATTVESATSESATMKSAAAETTTAATSESAAVPAAAVTNLGRQTVSCMFRRRSRSRTSKRERFGPLR